MTTAAQIKALVQPFVARHPDLSLVKRLIVLKPFRHVLRGILMDGTQDPLGFTPRWFVDHLFEPRRRYHLSFGEEMFCPGRGSWDRTRDDVQDLLFRKLEEVALPKLRPIVTFEDFLDCVATTRSAHLFFEEPVKRIVLDIARGDLEMARRLSREAIAKKTLTDPHLDDFEREHLRKVKALCALLEKNDCAGMARFLHEWEAETVKLMKLDHLWEPTPFPLELM